MNLIEIEERKDIYQLNTVYFFNRPVLGKILILPRSSAQNFVYEKPWACISIATDPSELAKINQVQRVELLQLTFEDLEGCPAGFAEKFPEKAKNMFTEAHAQQILEFSKKWWNKIDLLMIHCYAGVSRSPAVGKALSDIYQSGFSDYFDMMFSPNKMVYSTIKKVYANE